MPVVFATEVDHFAASAQAGGDEAAYSVDIDGTRVVLGLPGAAALAGAAVVFDCSATPCVQIQRLTAGAAAAGDEFGHAVAIAGDLLAVASPHRGTVTVYRRGGSVWNVETTLAPPSGAADGFGSAISLSGTRLAVGAPAATTAKGRVDVFSNTGTSWALEQSLTPTATGAQFGASVALDGSSLVVGAPFQKAAASTSFARGAVYVYLRGASWSLQATLQPAALADGDLFGFAVALESDRAVVGAPKRAAERGSAFAFERSGVTWSAGTELISSVAQAGDDVGWSVALAGTRAVVGAPYASTDPGGGCGRLDVFDRGASAWAFNPFGAVNQAELGELLGWATAISGDRIVAGAPGRPDEDVTHLGAAYRFDPNLRLFNGTFETKPPPCVGID